MTPEQKLLAFAEALRWKDLRKISGRTPEEDHWVGKRFIARHFEWSRELPLPDWPGDLNAMHEAEKVLTDGQYAEWSDKLYVIHQKACDEDMKPWRWLSSTAAQRFEAMGRTLNLWTE